MPDGASKVLSSKGSMEALDNADKAYAEDMARFNRIMDKRKQELEEATGQYLEQKVTEVPAAHETSAFADEAYLAML